MSGSGPETHSSLKQTNEALPAAERPTRSPKDVLPLARTSVPSRTVASNPHVKPTRRIQFVDLAEQLRIERYLDNRKNFLARRRRILQKVVALSARLHRNGGFIRDGLVEILRSEDASCFKRVHQHAQNLVDVCYSRWNMELHALDTLDLTESPPAGLVDASGFFRKLTAASQRDLLALITCLRTDAKYLVSRLKALSASQIVALSTAPRWEAVSERVLTSLERAAHEGQKYKALIHNVKMFESHSLSFDRSNPLSFLLFNVYGTEYSSAGPESQLRNFTWSTVLADLASSHHQAYRVLVPLLLRSFASFHEWRVKDNVELFLMNVLQTGAFLMDSVASSKRSGPRNIVIPKTPQADAFFKTAVLDLFDIFMKCDWGFPSGALQFVTALLGALPTEQLQMDLRTFFLFDWFFDQFLASAIVYPENENMLLNFHVSENARRCILVPLHHRLREAAYGYSASPAQDIDPAVRFCVGSMTGALDAAPLRDPYSNPDALLEVQTATSSIVICAAEIVRTLEALSPQAMHGPPYHETFLTASTSAFHAQHYRLADRFDRLKRELYYVLEPGSSQTDTHPCDEQWLDLQIDGRGKLQQRAAAETAATTGFGEVDTGLDLAQRGALRLCKEYIATEDINANVTSYWPDIPDHCSLAILFQGSGIRSDARRNPVSQLFWEEALEFLHDNYPLSKLTGNDTAVFSSLMVRSKSAQSELSAACAQLEADTSILEDMSSKMKSTVNVFLDRFEELKLKLWYSTDVINSKPYEDAKNITDALNNMALSALKDPPSSQASVYSLDRPRSSRSTASSVFRKTLDDTLGMLKAPSDRGGPKKLADAQIERTRRWLQPGVIDNFCIGEERIHRFCMEISITAKIIVGESSDFAASPVLWHSPLFAHERSFYDTYAFGITSAPASTRPASLLSETYGAGFRPPVALAGSVQSSRTTGTDDRRSTGRRINLQGMGSSTFDRDSLRPGSTAYIGSPGKASATTAESFSTFWSPLPSNTRSVTSASNYSRPASTFNDFNLNRFSETSSESTRFRDKIRHKLICLLLSDLGRTVWSMGSETDAWLKSSREIPVVDQKLKRRMVTESLIAQRREGPSHQQQERPNLKRSSSVSSSSRGSERGTRVMASASSIPDDPMPVTGLENDRYMFALDVLLGKLKACVDPMHKLRVIEDFHATSVAQMCRTPQQRDANGGRVRDASPAKRRNSLDEPVSRRQRTARRAGGEADIHSSVRPSDQDIIAQLTRNLVLLNSETLFRDLQYVAAFVPSGSPSKTSRSTAFAQLGLAALSYKDAVLDSLLHVADKLVTTDPVTQTGAGHPSEGTIMKAAEYWMLAAREGKSFAQRELAMLYLTYPQSLPIVTLPLSTTADIFRDEMRWLPHPDNPSSPSSTSSLCLAFHWMKLAAHGGDAVAQQKLAERHAHISLP